MLPRGQIFFDATCGLCTESYRKFGRMTERRGFRWIPLQDRRAQQLLGIEDGVLPSEIKILTRKGHIVGGADGLLYVARFIWWAKPIWLLSHVPGVRPVMRWAYRLLARNRHAVSGACGFDPTQPRDASDATVP